MLEQLLQQLQQQQGSSKAAGQGSGLVPAHMQQARHTADNTAAHEGGELDSRI